MKHPGCQGDVNSLQKGRSLQKADFFPLVIASEHSAFLLTEVLASKVPTIPRKFVSKEATAEATILKLYWRYSVRLELGRGEKSLQHTDFASFTGPARCLFFAGDYPHYHHCYNFPKFGARWAQNNMAQTNLLDGIRQEDVAWLLSTVQNDGNHVVFWTSLETNFIRKIRTLQAYSGNT